MSPPLQGALGARGCRRARAQGATHPYGNFQGHVALASIVRHALDAHADRSVQNCPMRFRPRVPALTSGAKRQRALEGAGPKGPRTPTAISKGTQHWHAWCAMCLPPMPIELYKIAHHVDESSGDFENARLFFAKALSESAIFDLAAKTFRPGRKAHFGPAPRRGARFLKTGTREPRAISIRSNAFFGRSLGQNSIFDLQHR